MAEAQSLASANKRVSNILQKQGDTANTDDAVDPSLFKEAAEQQLADKLEQCRLIAEPLFQNREYTAGLEALAGSKQAIDNFFEKVLVMDEDLALRANRIKLLAALRTLFLQVADISYLHQS